MYHCCNSIYGLFGLLIKDGQMKKKSKIIHPIEIWVSIFLYLYFSMYNINAAGLGDWSKPKPPSPTPPIQSPKPGR
jgi:hypothetical protein